MFVGRERELRQLADEFDKPRPSLVITFGRRRIGKSRLLREAVGSRRHIFFQATRVSPELNFEVFKAQISAGLDNTAIIDGLGTWEATFHFLANAAATEATGLVVVIDEFPYLTDGDPALPSVLQKFWDSGAANAGNLKLVLCGSAISQMEELLAERNPLYGRATKRLIVKQLPLRDVATFFPTYTPEELVTAYAIFGGVPHYLQLCNPDVSLEANVARLLLSDTGALVDEPNTLLQGELRDPAFYSSILAAVAQGCISLNEIATRLGRETKAFGPYLQKLEQLDLIEISRSLDASDKARNTRYTIKDRLIAFWHWFVRPNLSAIAEGFEKEIWDTAIVRKLPEYLGTAFESICIDHMRQFAQETMGSPHQVVGQIWGAADYDIDVAGRLLDGTFFYGECKWRSSRVDLGMVGTLRDRVERVTYGRDHSGKQYVIFSRNGFKPEVEALAGTDSSIHLVGLSELVRRPQQAPRPTRGA